MESVDAAPNEEERDDGDRQAQVRRLRHYKRSLPVATWLLVLARRTLQDGQRDVRRTLGDRARLTAETGGDRSPVRTDWPPCADEAGHKTDGGGGER